MGSVVLGLASYRGAEARPAWCTQEVWILFGCCYLLLGLSDSSIRFLLLSRSPLVFFSPFWARFGCTEAAEIGRWHDNSNREDPAKEARSAVFFWSFPSSLAWIRFIICWLFYTCVPFPTRCSCLRLSHFLFSPCTAFFYLRFSPPSLSVRDLLLYRFSLSVLSSQSIDSPRAPYVFTTVRAMTRSLSRQSPEAVRQLLFSEFEFVVIFTLHRSCPARPYCVLQVLIVRCLLFTLRNNPLFPSAIRWRGAYLLLPGDTIWPQKGFIPFVEPVGQWPVRRSVMMRRRQPCHVHAHNYLTELVGRQKLQPTDKPGPSFFPPLHPLVNVVRCMLDAAVL